MTAALALTPADSMAFLQQGLPVAIPPITGEGLRERRPALRGSLTEL